MLAVKDTGVMKERLLSVTVYKQHINKMMEDHKNIAEKLGR